MISSPRTTARGTIARLDRRWLSARLTQWPSGFCRSIATRAAARTVDCSALEIVGGVADMRAGAYASRRRQTGAHAPGLRRAPDRSWEKLRRSGRFRVSASRNGWNNNAPALASGRRLHWCLSMPPRWYRRTAPPAQLRGLPAEFRVPDNWFDLALDDPPPADDIEEGVDCRAPRAEGCGGADDVVRRRSRTSSKPNRCSVRWVSAQVFGTNFAGIAGNVREIEGLAPSDQRRRRVISSDVPVRTARESDRHRLDAKPPRSEAIDRAGPLRQTAAGRIYEQVVMREGGGGSASASDLEQLNCTAVLVT